MAHEQELSAPRSSRTVFTGALNFSHLTPLVKNTHTLVCPIRPSDGGLYINMDVIPEGLMQSIVWRQNYKN